jgi:hypothetical protein
MMCSQAEARSGEWIGLAYFESKPEWMNLDSTNFGEKYSPPYQGYSNCVRWTGSEYSGEGGDGTSCNPWDDDGTITASEIIRAITLWSASTPPAPGCDLLTANGIISMITTWSNQS